MTLFSRRKGLQSWVVLVILLILIFSLMRLVVLHFRIDQQKPQSGRVNLLSSKTQQRSSKKFMSQNTLLRHTQMDEEGLRKREDRKEGGDGGMENHPSATRPSSEFFCSSSTPIEKARTYDDVIRERMPSKYYDLLPAATTVPGQDETDAKKKKKKKNDTDYSLPQEIQKLLHFVANSNQSSVSSVMGASISASSSGAQEGIDEAEKGGGVSVHQFPLLYQICNPFSVPFRPREDENCRQLLTQVVSLLSRISEVDIPSLMKSKEQQSQKEKENLGGKEEEDEEKKERRKIETLEKDEKMKAASLNALHDISRSSKLLSAIIPRAGGVSYFLKEPLAVQLLANTDIERNAKKMVADRGGRTILLCSLTITLMKQKFEQRTIKYTLEAETCFEDGTEEGLGGRPSRRFPSLERHVPPFDDDDDDDVGDHNKNNKRSFFEKSKIHAITFILKVPQILFPNEPFSEAASFLIDRKLKVQRTPFTFFTPFPMPLLRHVTEQVDLKQYPMVSEFKKSSHVSNFREWVEKDFFQFVGEERRGRGGKVWGGMKKAKKSNEDEDDDDGFMKNTSHVYVSLQIFMIDVKPVLESVLRVPYSKARPGWHRWFNPSYFLPGGYQGNYASQLALSELAMLDYILLNNDRSPNKNNFVVGGCSGGSHRSSACQQRRHHFLSELSSSFSTAAHLKKEKDGVKKEVEGSPAAQKLNRRNEEAVVSLLYEHHLRPSNFLPTFLHLDQGMAFVGFLHEHNPIAKKKNINTFCLYYKPFVLRLSCLSLALVRKEMTETGDDQNSKNILGEMEKMVSVQDFLRKMKNSKDKEEEDEPEKGSVNSDNKNNNNYPWFSQLQSLWEKEFEKILPKPILRMLGRRTVHQSARQIPNLFRLVHRCLLQYNESVVLQPS